MSGGVGGGGGGWLLYRTTRAIVGGEKFPKSSVVPQRFCKVTS